MKQTLKLELAEARRMVDAGPGACRRPWRGGNVCIADEGGHP